MKFFKSLLVFSILLGVLFALNVYAATPIPTISLATPTPTPTISLATPTPTIKPTPTPFSQMNVHMHNDTGKTANDLDLFIEGKVDVLKWWSSGNWPFKDISYVYDPVTNITTIRFYNGTVAHCERIDCCLWLNTDKIIEKYARKWSWDGVPYAIAGPAISQDFNSGERDVVDLKIANEALDGGPIVIGILQVGPAKRVYSLPELLWRNPQLDQEVPWIVTQNDIPLNIGEAITSPAILMPADAASIVYRAKIWFEADPNHVVEYVGQYVPAKDYVVLYEITSDWGAGATVNVTIINNTPMPVNGWTLEWIFPGDQKITNLWNATYVQNGASVAVKNGSFNAIIPPNGGKVNFGFNMSYSGINAKPTVFMLNGIPCQIGTSSVVTP